MKRAALELILEITANVMCDCHKPTKAKRYCPTCEIYTIAHGALGCGAKSCPVVAQGKKKIREFKQ